MTFVGYSVNNDITRAWLRNQARTQLRNWPTTWVLDTTISSATETSVVLTAKTGVTTAQHVKAGDVLEVGSEIMKVLSVSTNTCTVDRGYRGTTAASTIASGSTVYVHREWAWTNAELNDCINRAIDWTWPEVWWLDQHNSDDEPSVVNTIAEEDITFELPTGVSHPNNDILCRFEIQGDNDTYWRLIKNYVVEGNQVILPWPSDQDYAVKLTLIARIPRMSADSDKLQVDQAAGAIIYETVKIAMEGLMGNRVRYTEYSASVGDRASTPDEIQRTLYHFHNQAVLEKDRVTRPKPPTYARQMRR